MHACGLCGQRDHREEGCPTEAGDRVRELKQKIMDLTGKASTSKMLGRGTKRRAGPQATSTFRKKLRVAYSGEAAASRTGLAPHRKALVAEQVREELARSPKERAPQRTTKQALVWLQSRKVYKKPVECLHCNGKLKGPFIDKKSKGLAHYFCRSKDCNVWINATRWSPFDGSKLPLPKIVAIIEYYCKLSSTAAARSLDVAAQCSVGLKPADAIVRCLRLLEARAGEQLNKDLMLTGDLEVDCHGVRKCYVSLTNPHFRAEISDLKSRNPGKQFKYSQLHIRIAGIAQRCGKLVIAILPYKLVPPSARPPVESILEVRSSQLLHRAKDPATIFADGAQAWTSVAAQDCPWLLKREVVHSEFEFTREVTNRKGGSKLAGTQSIDQRWRRLDDYIPEQLNIKAERQVNPELWGYVYSWLWRHNNPGQDLLKGIMQLCDAEP